MLPNRHCLYEFADIEILRSGILGIKPGANTKKDATLALVGSRERGDHLPLFDIEQHSLYMFTATGLQI